MALQQFSPVASRMEFPIGSDWFPGVLDSREGDRSRSQRGPFSGRVQCHSAPPSDEKPFLQIAAGRSSGQKRQLEQCWRELFSDPQQWWDTRSEKANPRYPDFKHKTTQQGLWLDSKLNPPWVEVELAAMSPGTIQQNPFAWNKMLARYVKDGQYRAALELFQQMKQGGIPPDRFTFTSVLNAIARLRAPEEGRHVHMQIIQSGCESDICVGSSLVDMYAKCGSIEDALTAFNKMTTRDVVAWSALIKGYVDCGQGEKALKLSWQMQEEGVKPDHVTFLAILSACASVGALEQGRRVHEQIIQGGLGSGVFLSSSLVAMYAKCGSIEDAWEVFETMSARDVIAWNAMIQGFAKCGEEQKALVLARQMQQEGFKPDPRTFAAMLNACANAGTLEEGRHIHQQIMQSGLEHDGYLGCSLVHMYVNHGSIDDAWRIFHEMPIRNVVAWNVLILALVKRGEGQKALGLYGQMQQEGIEPEAATFMAVLNACASEILLEEGRGVHAQIIQKSLESDVFVGSSLVDMYVKCGGIEDAWKVFSKLPTHDVVSWSTMIQGFVKCGQGQKALELYGQMQQEGVEPDPITLVGVLNACASLVSLEEGRLVHRQIIKEGWESDVVVGNSLIDMYAKCGNLADAQRVFDKMPIRDAVSWTSMLGAYTIHGHAEEAVKHFERMSQEGVEMTGITFVLLLSACSHGGLVDEGLRYFESMKSVYNVSMTVEHYSCMVDLLGRSGRLNAAESIVRSMPCKPDAPLLRALLSACRDNGNVEMGERTAKQLLELFTTASDNVLLSNMYAAAGDWERSENVRKQGL